MEKESQNKQFNFRAYAWLQFKKNKPAYYSFRILVCLVIIALLAPVIANEKPLYMKYKGEVFFPALIDMNPFYTKNNYELTDKASGTVEKIQLDIADWKRLKLDGVIWTPITYSPGKSDLFNLKVSPLGKQEYKDNTGNVIKMPSRFRHWLGTSVRGEDVFAGLIHGSRISLSIGFLSMGIASILGLVLGAMAGYFGDNKLSTSLGSFWTFILGCILAFYYGLLSRSFALSDALATSGAAFLFEFLISILVVISICIGFYYFGKLVGKIPFLNKKVFIPVDAIVSRVIEILISLPVFILIISLAAIAKPSMVNLMVIIGLTSWTGIARLTRAEFLRIRNMEYIQAGQALGFSESRIIFRHALANGIAPALVSIAFGIASAILVESSLSFLGVGVPPESVTWGSLISVGKANFDAPWLVVFPGLAIFMTVTIYNLLGDGLRDALDPRLKK